MVLQTSASHVQAQASLPDQAIQDFLATFRGRVILPGHTDYEAARTVRNGMIDRRPAIIARCAGVADVVQAVGFAREHGLVLSVRGGAHNVAGNASNDGGLVVDLSAMRSVHVDPAARIARVEGGATWGDVDRETQLHGLVAPGGVVSSTGVGGLTLHGGYGHARRAFGLSVDNLLSAEVVTADGSVLTASATSHPDLYWAIRGAGANFGVVTSFEFRLHPLGPEVFLCAPAYPQDQAPAILQGWRQYVEAAPDEVSSLALLWNVPTFGPFPPGIMGQPVVILAAVYAGPVAEGMEAMQPLRELGEPLLDLSHATSWVDLQSAFDPFFPVGLRYYWKSMFLDDLEGDAVDTMASHAGRRPSPMSSVTLWHLGGAIGRVDEADTAYGRRDATYLITGESTWVEARDDEANIAWSRGLLDAMRPHSKGGLYLNFAGLGEDKPALVREAYGEKLERLARVKARYDPDTLFRMNITIPPAV